MLEVDFLRVSTLTNTELQPVLQKTVCSCVGPASWPRTPTPCPHSGPSSCGFHRPLAPVGPALQVVPLGNWAQSSEQAASTGFHLLAWRVSLASPASHSHHPRAASTSRLSGVASTLVPILLLAAQHQKDSSCRFTTIIGVRVLALEFALRSPLPASEYPSARLHASR